MMNIPSTKVAIEPVYESDFSPSGLLYIPEEAKGRVNQGIVKYVGPKVKQLEIGDYVLFGGYSGSLVFIEGEGRTIILDEKFVVARIDPPNNVQSTDIPGLYFRDGEGNHFSATYERVMWLVAEMVKNTPFRRTFKTNLSNIDTRESKYSASYDFEKDR